MDTNRAKEILDELQISYKDVKRGSYLYVIMEDGSRIPFYRLLRDYKRKVADEVSDLMFSPTQEYVNVNNVDTQAPTEAIVKHGKRKSKKNSK